MDSTTQQWLALVYGDHQDVQAIRRLLAAHPELPGTVPLATGDEAAIRSLISAGRVDEPTDPQGMPPLFAVTFSRLIGLTEFAGPLRNAARLLLESGANPNCRWTHPQWPGSPLSALYGAAGANHDVEMTKILLGAGADPNDNESLYHSLESTDPSCTRLLIEAGVRVGGTNSLYHALDYDDLDRMKLLVANGGDANEKSPHLGSPLQHAIRRGRSVEHIRVLLDAGADPRPAYRYAVLFGRPDIAEALGVTANLTPEDEFVAACARADREAAKAMLDVDPDLMQRLTSEHLAQLPNLLQARCTDAVRLMVELGWPLSATGADWHATALNVAVFQGDPSMTRFLLQHGASWTERHGHNDNVMGTLSWASLNRPEADGDWEACARELIAGGMPAPPDTYQYSPEVQWYFASLR